MSPFTTRLFASTILAAALAMPAAAQEVRNLDRETSNVRVFTGYVGSEPQTFEVNLPAGTSITIDAISTSSIDPYLTVSDARSGDVLGEDDDSGGDLNSQFTVRAAESDRRLSIEVKQFSFSEFAEGDVGGSFDLRLATFVPVPAEPITFGGSVEGTLEAGGERRFVITGEEGMILQVGMLATGDDGFDPYLRLLDANDEELVSNDDGGEGLNSLVAYLMQDDAPLTIVASGYSAGAGQFTLQVGERQEPIVQAPLQVIGIDDPATGRLGPGYESGGINPSSIDYQLSEAAIAAITEGSGEVTIKMVAQEGENGFGSGIDSFLEIGFDTPLGFAVVDSDDDGAGDLNAMIPIDLSDVAADPALLSRLRIRAQAFGGSLGDYTLTITEGMEARAVTDLDMIELAPPPVVVPSPE